MIYNLKEYKDMFGAPNTGVHQYRILDIAVVDLGVTLGASYLISKKLKISYYKTVVSMLLLGIVIHRIFGVKTKVDKLLFD